VRADERVCLRLVAGGDNIDEGIEIIRERLQRPGGERLRIGQLVEVPQHPQRQPVVEMVAVAAQLAVADDGIDLAVTGAFREFVRNNGHGGEEGGSPGIVERAALGAGAQGVGALPADARRPCRLRDRAGGGERAEEDADSRRGPAVGTLGTMGACVAAAGEGIGDELDRNASRWRGQGLGICGDHIQAQKFALCSDSYSRTYPIIQEGDGAGRHLPERR